MRWMMPDMKQKRLDWCSPSSVASPSPLFVSSSLVSIRSVLARTYKGSTYRCIRPYSFCVSRCEVLVSDTWYGIKLCRINCGDTRACFARPAADDRGYIVEVWYDGLPTVTPCWSDTAVCCPESALNTVRLPQRFPSIFTYSWLHHNFQLQFQL